jgi:inorganic pyrophosphatase
VLIFNHDPIDRGSLVRCRVLGILDFVDNDEIDYKIIAVPYWSPKSKYPRLNSIEPEHLKIFKQFFKIYKIDRANSVKVGEWKNGRKALRTVTEAHQRWNKRQEDGNV